jgi:hypothetical protein
MKLNKHQKAMIRANLSLAVMFLKRAEEASNADHFDNIGNALIQMDGALFEVRQELALDKEQTLITEEYHDT